MLVSATKSAVNDMRVNTDVNALLKVSIVAISPEDTKLFPMTSRW